MVIAKRNKGHSLIQLPDNYCIVDAISTGRSPIYDDIIELAAVKISDGKITNSIAMSVKPRTAISDYVTFMTDIANATLNNAPSIDEIIPDLLAFVGDDLIVGHNTNFIVDFIYHIAFGLGGQFKNDYIDIARISRLLLPLPDYKLKTLSLACSSSYFDRQSALANCYSVFNCFTALRRIIDQEYHSAEDFIQYATADPEANLISNALYKQVCVFAGTFRHMPKKRAMQLAVDLGGICADKISEHTDYLILGNADYARAALEGIKSSKQKQAERQNIIHDAGIEILTEDDYYSLVYSSGIKA